MRHEAEARGLARHQPETYENIREDVINKVFSSLKYHYLNPQNRGDESVETSMN